VYALFALYSLDGSVVFSLYMDGIDGYYDDTYFSPAPQVDISPMRTGITKICDM
jgi:hypothetical protein